MISRLGRFEIQAEIGRGGFGQVFKAFDPVMNRVVAVKILTATEDAGSFTRFKNEATAAGNLHHENIVTVYEFGQEGTTPFLVMEYLNGDDLQHIIKNNTPMSLYRRVRVMDQVADGLHCAHRNGVLHRDVKPANIMVLQDGLVKIMDFGIARLMRDTSTRLTQQGYLIGTVVYMAPELFSGTEVEVDALCDIWSYGVIMYELLAGKNPFQTGSMQSEMYRIVNQDPAPLPPEDCPAELQAVVSKLLCRQRESRYQTLEDTRFDLQPILKNLEKAESDRLLSNAQQLMFQQQWAEALSTAREARRMDPQNGTARIIFERAQTELQRQSIRPRIDDLLRRSSDVAEQRKFSEAIELLEGARKLDTGNEKVLSRLQGLRALKQRIEDAARLFSEAGKELRDNRLTTAFEHVSEAVSLDPDNQEAKRLLENIQSEVQAREAERALESEMRRARGLMAIDDLDGALATLKAAESKYPGRGDTRDLLAKVTQLIAERERRRDFSRRLEHAKDSVRNTRYEEAVKELEQLLAAFPNEVEATDLLSYARQELRAKQRSEEVKRITEAVNECNRAQRFSDAIRLLEDGLKKYPDDLPLTRLLRSTHADHQAFERERALQDGLRRCEALRQGGQLQEALDLVARLISENQNNRDLLDLEGKIRQEKTRVERAAAIRSAVEQAETLLRAGKPDPAAGVLEAAILALGAERDLTALMDKVKEAQRAERERQYIESELKHAKGFEQRGDITTSLKIIDDALLRSPKSKELLAARERLSTDHAQVQRKREVAAKAAAVEEALQRKEWPQARAQLDEATKQFPSDSVFSKLAEELARRKNEHIEQLVQEGRRILDAGQVAEAQKFFEANLLDHRAVAAVMSLGRDIVGEKRRRENVAAQEAQRVAVVADCLRTAQDCERKGDLPGALYALQKGLDRYPQEAELTSAHKRVGGQIAAAKQSQVLAGIRQALERSNWPQAIQLIDQARLEYPNDPALIPLQAKALDQRRAFLDRAAAAIRSKLAENKLDDARTLFDQSLTPHQDQSIVREVGQEIARAEEKRAFISDNLRQAALCEQQDAARARAILQNALKQYPGDPELSSALGRVDAAIERGERGRKLAEATGPIKRDVDRGNWQAALKRMDEARTAFPDVPPELAGLEQQARRLRDREVQALVDKVDGCLKTGNLSEAEKLLNKSSAQFAGDPAVAASARALEEEKVCQSLIQTARSNIVSRHFEESEAVINELAARRPNDPEEPRLRTALKAAREQERKEKLYRTGRAEGDQLLRNRQYAEAIARFEYLLTQFPGDRQLQQDLAGARAAEERSQKAAARQTATVSVPDVHQKDAAPQPKWLKPAIAGAAVAGLAGLIFWIWFTPALIVVPEQLSFKFEAGAMPEAQKITVTGPSEVALPQTNADWLLVTRENTATGGTTFLVRILPVKLTVGEHQADLIFAQQKKVHVDLVVTRRPLPPIDVQPASLIFPYSRGSIQAQKILATSSSDIPDPKSTQGWVKITRHDLGSDKAEFLVQVLPNGLAAGKNTAELIFSPDKTVTVELTVPSGQEPPPPPLEVQPAFLAFPGGGMQQRITATGPTIPEPKSSEPWLTAARANSRGGKTDFLVQASAAGLASGKHIAYLTFSPQKRVTVELTVPAVSTPPPPPPQTLDVQPLVLRFRYKRTGSPEPQTITATGPSDIADPQKTVPWISITRRNAGANKAEFVVQVLADKLAPGDYHDELTFPQQKKVRVDLVVFDPPQRFCYLQGTNTWSGGTLKPNEELDIRGSRVGSGRVDPALPTCEIVIDGSRLPAGLSVIENPTQDNNFTLRLRYSSGSPLSSFTIPWSKK